MILWRPVELHEMAKVFEAGMKGFPPRLPEQSIFYPVLVQEYADQTAATWNTKEEPFVGYVIEMEILDEYGARFSHKQSVQLSIVSCGCLRRNSQFNNQLTKPVSVRRAYFGPKYRGHVPDKFGLRAADAYKQIAMMVGTMDYSMFDFAMEVSANMLTFFLNFPFWKAAGAGRLDVEAVQLDTCLEHIRNAWSRSPRPAALVEDATCTA